MARSEDAPLDSTGTYQFLCVLERLATGTGLTETAEEADQQLIQDHPNALEVIQVMLDEIDARVLKTRGDSEFIE